jgi:hypothetical protein
MSRALAAALRAPLDLYVTPDALAEAICARLVREGVAPRSVVEPSAGHGAFVRASRAAWPQARVVAVDVDTSLVATLKGAGAHTVVTADWVTHAPALAEPEGCSLCRGQGGFGGAFPDVKCPDCDGTGKVPGPRLFVGNPPFRQAAEHIEAALSVMHPGDVLALVLRLGFMASTSRLDFWTRHPVSELAAIVPRPRFSLSARGTKDGIPRLRDDACDYALMVWRAGDQGPARITEHLVWKP